MQYDLAEDFERELSAYSHVPGLIEHVRGACGAEQGASLVGQQPIAAYLIRQTDAVFSAYVLTGTSFVVAEMSASGATLAVWIDQSRIARIYEIVDGGERLVGIEIEADARRIEISERGRGEEETGRWASEASSTGRVVPASYELRGKVEERSLTWFALQLRRLGR